METEGRVRTYGNLGFSDPVLIHDGAKVKVHAKATLIRRPDGTPHSVQVVFDRWERAGVRQPWPSQPSDHIRLEGPDFDELFANMAAWREALPHGRSTRYVTLLIDEDKPDAQGILQLVSGLRRNPRAFLPVIRMMEEEDSAVLQAASNLARMRRSKFELERLIERDPPERDLQTWFEAHPWIFGSEYVGKEGRRQFGIDAQADFIMRTADDFVDLFELKKASEQVLLWDPSHRTYRPSAALALVLGQSLQYLETMDDHKMVLRQRFALPLFYPRIRIVIGRSSDWDEPQRSALRRLNAHLNGIEVLTFDQILARAGVMIGYLADSLDAEDEPEAMDVEGSADLDAPSDSMDVDEIPF